jgi:molybdenum cofactor cytidylyltransferase
MPPIARATTRHIGFDPPSCRRLGVLVLAAGGSRRLGRPKQLVRLGGEPLLLRAARLAQGLRADWIGVVIAPGRSQQRLLLARLPVTIVTARDWQQGLASSLRAGVKAAPAELGHLLILTVDQWRIDGADLRQLVHRAAPAPTAARYRGIRGIPAVFPRRCRSALLGLNGDQGARALLTAARAHDVAMAHAADDLDTPVDLAALHAARPRGRR